MARGEHNTENGNHEPPVDTPVRLFELSKASIHWENRAAPVPTMTSRAGEVIVDGRTHGVAYWTIFHRGEYQRIDPFPQSAVELESVGRWSHRTRVFLKGRTRFRRV